MTTHVEKSDSSMVAKSWQKDSVVKYVEKTIIDTFYQEIVVDKPCDANGNLKNGYKQRTQIGNLLLELLIENDQIKVRAIGSKKESVSDRSYESSKKADSVAENKNKSVVKTSEKVIEKKTSLWDRIKAVVGWIGSVVLSIIVWELFLKNVFKTFINLIK